MAPNQSSSLCFDFGPCVVEHIPERRLTITRFRDGSECHAIPHDTEDYRDWTRKAGCVSVDEYAFQHDLFHVLYGLIVHNGPSPALHREAKQEPQTDDAGAEEEFVQRLHRFFNVNSLR